MPRWVDAREGVAEEEEDEPSSEEDEEEADMDQAEEPAEQNVEDEEPDDTDERAQTGASAGPSGQKQKITIPLGNRKLVCHVSPRSSPADANAHQAHTTDALIRLTCHAEVMWHGLCVCCRALTDAPQVCGKRGHCAGFVGSVYHDCPFKVGCLLSTLLSRSPESAFQ